MKRCIQIIEALFLCAFIGLNASASPTYSGTKSNQATFPTDSTGPIVSKVLTKVKGGYTITFVAEYFQKRIGTTDQVDVALVDFTSMLAMKLPTFKDTMNAIRQIYSDPAKFSIVSGKITPTTTRTANLSTSCMFKFDIANPKYTIVIVRGNGISNCGSKTAPPNFTAAGSSGCSCTACGGCCYREGPDNHCVYCN